MEIMLLISIGVLITGGCYLLLQRRLLRAVVGLSILSQGVNLVIFTAGKVQSSKPAFIQEGASVLEKLTVDPLPQALILTAIVIGFAMVAFFVVLTYRVYQESGTDNLDQMLESDQ
jgi:multicomponent Na+:H+ antiporter subunit C